MLHTTLTVFSEDCSLNYITFSKNSGKHVIKDATH